MRYSLQILRRQRTARVQFGLGHGAKSLIRCINLLIAHHICIQSLTCKEERFSPLIPVAIEVTMKNPGRKKMKAILSALNEITYGCRELVVDPEIF
jgi:hypothetical protein